MKTVSSLIAITSCMLWPAQPLPHVCSLLLSLIQMKMNLSEGKIFWNAFKCILRHDMYYYSQTSLKTMRKLHSQGVWIKLFIFTPLSIEMHEYKYWNTLFSASMSICAVLSTIVIWSKDKTAILGTIGIAEAVPEHPNNSKQTSSKHFFGHWSAFIGSSSGTW